MFKGKYRSWGFAKVFPIRFFFRHIARMLGERLRRAGLSNDRCIKPGRPTVNLGTRLTALIPCDFVDRSTGAMQAFLLAHGDEMLLHPAPFSPPEPCCAAHVCDGRRAAPMLVQPAKEVGHVRT